MIKLDKELAYKKLSYQALTSSVEGPKPKLSTLSMAIDLLDDIVSNYQIERKHNFSITSHLDDGLVVHYQDFKNRLNLSPRQVQHTLDYLQKYDLLVKKSAVRPYIPNIQKGGSEVKIYLKLENIKEILIFD